MIITIQCAATKRPSAASLCCAGGKRVVFVAQPELAPRLEGVHYAKPDDISDSPGLTWRQRLEKYNSQQLNPLGLSAAYQLYSHPAYSRLDATFGIKRVRILSAGWGLVRADYLLPYYDITFSRQADPYKRRVPSDSYKDFMQIDRAESGPIVFLGGKDYVPLFKKLVASLDVEKKVFFRCDPADKCPERRDSGFVMKPFRTTCLTNWHYACAEAICKGRELI